jgi:hypothetical protein
MAGSTPILPELCAKVKATFKILLELNFASNKISSKMFVNYNDDVLTIAECLHIIRAETEVYAHGCNNKFEYPHGSGSQRPGRTDFL